MPSAEHTRTPREHRDTITPMDADTLTIGQVAAILNVSDDTVRRIPRDSLWWKLTPGGHRRYAAEDVAAYLERLEAR
jgi:excisionase family DNA binding protein